VGSDLNVIENSSALHDRLSSPGGAEAKLETLTLFQMVSFVLGLCTLQLNWTVGYHSLLCCCQPRTYLFDEWWTHPMDEWMTWHIMNVPSEVIVYHVCVSVTNPPAHNHSRSPSSSGPNRSVLATLAATGWKLGSEGSDVLQRRSELTNGLG
jgi:hypothetical protein